MMLNMADSIAQTADVPGVGSDNIGAIVEVGYTNHAKGVIVRNLSDAICVFAFDVNALRNPQTLAAVFRLEGHAQTFIVVAPGQKLLAAAETGADFATVRVTFTVFEMPWWGAQI